MPVMLLVFIFGLLVGSFLNVVIHRMPTGASVVRPGSACPNCKNPIRWYQNLPVLSFLILGGKCSSCRVKIPFRYPLVEVLTAVLFVLSFRDLPMSLFSVVSQVRLWFFIASGIAITFIDLDHRIIPDELSLGGWAIGALTAYWDFRNGLPHLLVASVVGFGFFWLFAMAYEKVTGRDGLGGGDIKYMGTIGVFLGLGGIWSSIMISSVLGSLVGIAVAKFQKSDAVLRTAIPYGPFLVAGAFIELFFEVSKWISP